MNLILLYKGWLKKTEPIWKFILSIGNVCPIVSVMENREEIKNIWVTLLVNLTKLMSTLVDNLNSFNSIWATPISQKQYWIRKLGHRTWIYWLDNNNIPYNLPLLLLHSSATVWGHFFFDLWPTLGVELIIVSSSSAITRFRFRDKSGFCNEQTSNKHEQMYTIWWSCESA